MTRVTVYYWVITVLAIVTALPIMGAVGTLFQLMMGLLFALCTFVICTTKDTPKGVKLVLVSCIFTCMGQLFILGGPTVLFVRFLIFPVQFNAYSILFQVSGWVLKVVAIVSLIRQLSSSHSKN